LRDVVHHRVIGDPEHFYPESSIVQLASGDLLVTSPDNGGAAHTDCGSVVLSRSHDGGATWQSEHQTIFRAGRSNGWSSGPISCLRDGTLVCHADNTRYLVRSGDLSFIAPRGASEQETVYVTESRDEGDTWSEPSPVRIVPMRGCFVRDAIVELPDGALLMPLSGARHSLPHKFPPNDDDPFRSYLVRSDDGGASWYYFSTIAVDPGQALNLWEPAIAQLASGRLIALLRSDYVHMIAPPGGYLYSTYSDDGGASWSIPRRTSLWGYPADLVVLRDGRVLAAYGHRQDPLSVRVALSDDGVTWSASRMAALRDLPLYSSGAGAPGFAALSADPRLATLNVGYRHVGYPDACELADGRIAVVYHLFDETRHQCVDCTTFVLDA
jgi:hypothetical protein